MTAAADVVNLGRTRPLDEGPERADEIVRVNVVANLLTLVSVYDIGRSRYSTSREVC